MRVLVTGKEGQLARSLAAAAANGREVVTEGRPELDLAQPDSIVAAIGRWRPDIVVNAAAYTAVDKAETDSEQAFLVNATGAGAVAAAAAAAGIPVVHISTDYVFSGAQATPYVETDATGPLGVYGRSKLDGERAVATANPAHAIFRTAWVYSPYGANFLKTMLRLAADRPTLRVVADQTGTPSYAPDLADAILAACEKIVAAPQGMDWRGVFHLVSGGRTNWAAFAEAIFAQSAALGGPSATVEPIRTEDYPTPAKRPAFSLLDTARFTTIFGHELPDWQSGVARCVAALRASA